VAANRASKLFEHTLAGGSLANPSELFSYAIEKRHRF